ncbi:dipicolinate synthase subunit B [Pseudoruminococcus massiliensis]|uniref:dipicolinate synthase subunit B n=1 Tax=Pseudoruminococcus massiliensis TaxID=2086583 RepID=UPI003AB7FE14
MTRKTVGFAMCGSFCTFSRAIPQIDALINAGYDVLPIMSYNASTTDTRFGKAQNFIDEIEEKTKRKIIRTINDAEPIGPKAMTDIMLIAPCTGNTISKLSYGITDTPVTMAAKSHLRQEKPLIIAIATNDALGASAQSIGRMLNTKHIFFVPFGQDAPIKKPKSLVANFELIPQVVEAAFIGKQLQPIIIAPKNG